MDHPLTRKLTILISIKALALALLFLFFFAPSHRPNVDADSTARALLSEGVARQGAAP